MIYFQGAKRCHCGVIRSVKSIHGSYWLRIVLIVVCLFSVFSSRSAIPQVENFQSWIPSGDAVWSFNKDVVIATGGDGFLKSRSVYESFDLSVEFWVSSEANSGIFLRCQDRNFVNPESCYELNIWDDHPNQEARTGSIVGRVMPPLEYVVTAGRWNLYQVSAQDSTIIVKVNNILTAVLEGAELTRGFIALQKWGGGEVRFRNLRID